MKKHDILSLNMRKGFRLSTLFLPGQHSPLLLLSSCHFRISSFATTTGDSCESCNAFDARQKVSHGFDVKGKKGLSFDGKERLRRYSKLLHDCVSKGFLNDGKVVHGNLIRNRIELDSYLWVSLISFYAKRGELCYARKVLDVMAVRDVVSWTSLISGFVAEGYGRDSVVLFRDMRREAISPNEFTLATVLRACSFCLDVGFGVQVHAEAMKLGFLSDMFVGSTLVDVYARCGEMEFASRVFSGMPEKNVVVWNVLLNGYAEMGDGNQVLKTFCRMKEPEMKFNKFTLSTVLKGCANSGNARGGMVLHSLMIRVGYELDEFSSCALVDMYAKCGFVYEAIIMFKKIKCPDVVTWSAVIACLDQHKRTEEVVKLFNLMRSSGIAPNEFTFANVLSNSSDFCDQQFGQSIHACLLKHGFESDNLVGNALITMYMRNGCLPYGMKIFEDMAVWDSVSWNALLSGYCHSDEGPRMFRLMLMHGFQPTSDTFTSILKSCSNLLNVRLGKQVHAHTIKNCFSGDDHVLTALIDMYAKSGRLEDATVCFDKLMKRDVLAWTVIISGYAQNDQAEKAVMGFIQMHREGINPNEFTLSSCLSCCSSVKNGRVVHSMAIKAGCSDDLFVCSALIDMYGKCGCIEDAETVFEGLVSWDVATCNALIYVYSRHGLGEKALQAFEKMLDEGLIPDKITITGLLSACRDVGLIEEARMQCRSLLEFYRIIQPMEHYASMYGICG